MPADRVHKFKEGRAAFVFFVSVMHFSITVPTTTYFVPEPPRNLSCIQKGEHGTVTCTWDPGQDTLLKTRYTLQLTGPNNVTCRDLCSCQKCNHLNLGITLTPDLAESKFTVSVTAINDLGNSSSFPFTFTFLDI
ncbi:hypothetical protein STEG23_027916, partial [Scotinomys teguina]